MYKISPTLFGLRIVLAGEIDSEQASQFKLALCRLVKKFPVPFSAVVDTRELVPPPSDVLQILRTCLEHGRDNKMKKVVVAYRSPVIQSQAREISLLAGTAGEAREIDARIHENWEQLAINWIMNDVEPDFAPDDTLRIILPC